MSDWLHAQATLQSGNYRSTDWIGGWVGAVAGLDCTERREITPAGIQTPDHPIRSIVAIPTTLLRFLISFTAIRNSSVDAVTMPWTWHREIAIFFPSECPVPSWGSTLPVGYSEVKRPMCEPDHSYPFSVEVKNEWSSLFSGKLCRSAADQRQLFYSELITAQNLLYLIAKSSNWIQPTDMMWYC
jgi:hypothetical protein